ncbi:MAG TPA: MFS transporter, partial [Paraburkholderia sp.]|uniref:MFS transporter n=1 Tax=Paraburkholderia sp. TaxID=1926495 RepID=UPI002C80CDC4
RARPLLGCGIARLLLAALIPILLLIDMVSFPALCIVGFAVSAVKLLFDSVTIAVIPTIVQRDQLTKANSWYEAWNSSAASLGPALAGWLTQIFSISTVYVTNFVLYAASTFCLRGVVIPVRSTDTPVESSHLRDIAEGVALLWRNELQRTIAIAAGLFNLFHAAFFTVFTIFALKHLDFSAATFGSVISFVGVTGLAGALGAPALVTRVGLRTALVGSLLAIGPIGVPILFAGSMTSLERIATIAACLACWDFLIVVHVIIEQTIRQMTIESGQLSRITATTRFVSWGADPLGALLGGLAASSSIGIRGTMIVCLIGFTAAGLLMLTSKSIRNLSTLDALPVGRDKSVIH